MFRARPTLLGSLTGLVALALVAWPAGGEGSTLATAADIERGRVTRVIDGDTLDVRLESNESARVRLIGVDAPELRRDDSTADALARRATEFVRSRAAGASVRLERDAIGDTRDAYGRLLRYVRLADGSLLNLEIVAHGFARAMTRFDFSRSAEFRQAEATARAAGLGLWADEPPLRLAADEAAAHVGRRATVCGRVASARFVPRLRGRPTFLNLDRPYPDQPFTVVIWGDDRPRFGRPEQELEGRSICVSGRIELFRGDPQIVARDPGQIERVRPAD